MPAIQQMVLLRSLRGSKNVAVTLSFIEYMGLERFISIEKNWPAPVLVNIR